MFGWLARSARVEALEGEVASLRAALAELRAEAATEAERTNAAAAIALVADRLLDLRDRAAADADRSRLIETVLDRLGERLAAAEDAAARADVDRAALAGTGTIVERQGEEIATLRGSLRRLERQLQLYADSADKAAEALFLRIEGGRRAAAEGSVVRE